MASWHQASFLVADDASDQTVRDIMASPEDVLVFSSKWISECLTNERIVSGGPFILHPPVEEPDLTRGDDEDGGAREVSDVDALLGLGDGDVEDGTPGRNRRRARGAAGAREAPRPRKQSKMRVLEELGSAKVLDALVNEFDDFIPNEDGCVVRMVEFRG